MKHSLKYTHYIYADWKKTIESLQLRLTETLTQNNELKVTIEKLTAQIVMVEKQRVSIFMFLTTNNILLIIGAK